MSILLPPLATPSEPVCVNRFLLFFLKRHDVLQYRYFICIFVLQSTSDGNQGGNGRPAGQRNPPKTSKYAEFDLRPDNTIIYFLFDIDTTGSKRNWDHIIVFSFLCYDEDGSLLLGSLSRKINTGNVRINLYLTEHVHRKKVNLDACRLFILYFDPPPLPHLISN